MLGRLIKHEFKDTMRLFLPMFIIIAILTPIFSYMMGYGSDYQSEVVVDGDTLGGAIFGTGIMGYIFLLFALIIVTQVLIIARFYQTMTSTQAYMTFTLPVKTGSILLSKCIVAMVWYLVSAIVAVLSMFAVVLIATPITPADINEGIKYMSSDIDMSALNIVLLVILLLFSAAYTILRMYVSVMIGQLSNTHRVILSIAAYLVLSQAMSVFMSFLMVAFMAMTSATEVGAPMLILIIAITAILSALCYLVTYLLSAKKLNV